MSKPLDVTATTATSKKSLLSTLLRRNDTSIVLATLLLFLIFTMTSDNFFTSYNMFNVMRNVGLYFFIALGQAIVIVVGGMNLSLGAIGGLSVVTAGYSMQELGFPVWLSILVSLLVGAGAGYLNGIIIVKLKLNSFVVTLASSFIFTGLVLGVSKGFPYTKIPAGFTLLGREGVLGIPYLFIVMLIALALIAYLFKYTVIGRQILATGGNLTASRLSGIKTNNIILLTHIASGAFAAIAGLMFISRMGSATPDIGSDWLITSFAVSVIGGTALVGGMISAVGLFASSFLIVLIKNGLIMLSVNVYFEQTFLGSIILLAVAIEGVRWKSRSRKS